MYALISPEENIYSNNAVIGSRIAQVDATPFDVALPLNWVEVSDTVTAEGYYWDGTQALQIPVPTPKQVANGNPTVI
jgi:hypothetical protein